MYDKIEPAYEKLESSVDKVKERPALNTVVKTALPFITGIGPILSALYDNIGGGTKSEEDKAKQILEFLIDPKRRSTIYLNILRLRIFIMPYY